MEEANQSSELTQESAQPAYLATEPNSNTVFLGIAVGIWAFPLLISWGLFLFSLGDSEYLGFWVISRIGPFDLLLSSISEYWLCVFSLIMDIAFVAAIFKIIRSQRFQYSIFVLLGILAWYIWGLIIFVNSIHIA